MDGKFGEMKSDNFLPDYISSLMDADELYEYGIHTENSDIRAHVSPAEEMIYVFKTEDGIKAIKKYNPRIAPAKQPGYDRITARGWLVKLDWIKKVGELRCLHFKTWEKWGEFSPYLDTSKKGELAVQCVLDAMKLGRFPMWIDASEKDDKDIQISGTDILIFCEKRIQVKCDYPIKKTGNLFLQREERNPLKKH